MVNNSPISLLAGLLDFSLNSLACLAREPGFTNPSCTKLAFGPRRLRHPESLVVAITQSYSYSIDAEQNGKMISTLLRGNSCSVLLLEDDRFPLPSPSHLYSLFSIFVSIFSFSFISSFSWFSLFRGPYFSLLLLLTHYLFQISFSPFKHTQTHTDVYTLLHTREPNCGNTFPGILVQGILIGPFHISALWKKKILTCCSLTEWCYVCVLLSVRVCFYTMNCPNVTTRADIQRLHCKSCHLWVRIKVIFKVGKSTFRVSC